MEQVAPQNNDPGMVREQIGLEEVYELIDHLLEGEVLVKDHNGNRTWQKPADENMILLSPAGINFVRKKMSWHINKNTLLSNYTEDEITTIVKAFSLNLQDTLFLKSNVFFRQPTLEKCKSILRERMNKKVEIKAFARELLGVEVDKKAIALEVLKEVEGKVEKELEVIRAQLMKDREKEFESMVIDLEFLVWSTYNRALKGEERGSIRRHQQSLEVKGGGLSGTNGSEPIKPGLISSMFKK